jgi:hypothetical protein
MCARCDVMGCDVFSAGDKEMGLVRSVEGKRTLCCARDACWKDDCGYGRMGCLFAGYSLTRSLVSWERGTGAGTQAQVQTGPARYRNIRWMDR